MKIKLSPREYKVGSSVFLLYVVAVISIAAICAVVFVPYVIETWGAWMGYHLVIEWWKGILIYVAFGLLTRYASIYTVSAAALITWVFAASGFVGF